MAERAGLTLQNGCTISRHELNVEWRTVVEGTPMWFSKTSTNQPPLYVQVDDDQFVAEVISRCGGGTASTCPDPEQRGVLTQVTTKWAGEFRVYTTEVLYVPPAIANRVLAAGNELKYCYEALPPVGQPDPAYAYYWSTPIVNTGAIFIFGDRRDTEFSPNTSTGSFQPGPCQLIDIGGFDDHGLFTRPALGVIALEDSHTGMAHGFRVTRLGNGPNDYRANLHTWVEPGNRIFARILYKMSKPPGVDCAMPGMFGPLPVP